MVKVAHIISLPLVVYSTEWGGGIKKFIRFSILKANASTDNQGTILVQFKHTLNIVRNL